MTSKQSVLLNRPKIQIIMMAMLFFVPFFGSYVLFYLFPNLKPEGQLNYGTIVSPVKAVGDFPLKLPNGQPVSENPLIGKWTYIYYTDRNCEADCLRELVLSRQLRMVMSREASRVRRIFLVPSATQAAAEAAKLKAEHPDLLVLAQASASDTFATRFAGASAGGLVLVDPLGNWMMNYAPVNTEDEVKKDYKGMQKDLKRLLNLSHID